MEGTKTQTPASGTAPPRVADDLVHTWPIGWRWRRAHRRAPLACPDAPGRAI